MKTTLKKTGIMFGVGLAGLLSMGAAKPTPAINYKAEISEPYRPKLPVMMPQTTAVKAKKGKRLTKGSRHFRNMDLNHDGKISKAEMSMAAAIRFANIDANGDGLITQAEMKAYRKGKKAERKAKALEKRKAAKSKALAKKKKMAKKKKAKMKKRAKLDRDGRAKHEAKKARKAMRFRKA